MKLAGSTQQAVCASRHAGTTAPEKAFRGSTLEGEGHRVPALQLLHSCECIQPECALKQFPGKIGARVGKTMYGVCCAKL